ncbi:MAG: DUF4242 domain-containing protein [Bacteroidota bacterium]
MRSKTTFCTIMIGLLMCFATYAQDQGALKAEMNKDMMDKTETMKTYVIEREIPDAGKLSQEELKGISKSSNAVLSEMGPGIQWLHSYVTDNKVYCVYKAENEQLLREHAEKGGFPVNAISEMANKISPDTAKD